MTYTVTSWDRATFKRCRRAWDLGSRTRQNLEPVFPAQPFDLEEALRYALTVYYFPAMWDWSRGIVRPIALDGFGKSMREQRARYEQRHRLTPEEERDWAECLELGEALLRGYFEWALTVDHFETLHVEYDVDVIIPDPVIHGVGLVTPDGDSIYYRERLELLVVDENDQFWLVTHRLAGSDWADIDQLVLDEESLSQCWACEQYYMKVTIAGTIHNELRTASTPPVAKSAVDLTPEAVAWPKRTSRRYSEFGPESPPRPATEVVDRQTTEHFRRTTIARSHTEVQGFGRQLAALTQDITDSMLRVYPTPSWPHCRLCRYRSPCIAMNEGGDASRVLAESYRDRGPEKVERGRIGGSRSRWYVR
jgi:hypothetical protein